MRAGMGAAKADDAAAGIARVQPGRGFGDEVRRGAAILGQQQARGDAASEMEMNERLVAHDCESSATNIQPSL